MNDVNYCIPYVGGIIERRNNDETELLIQTRWKPDRDPIYSGTFEFPAGVLDKPFEDVFEALKREIKEETGLKLKSIKGESKTKIFSPKGNDASFAFRPFCCTQQLKEGKPWIGFIFICEVEEGEIVSQEEEAKDAKWFAKEDLRKIFEETPEKLFTLEIGAWEYYFHD
jgi:8-oxo-dGTP pyrophosphatase MutT (NUDIX family)